MFPFNFNDFLPIDTRYYSSKNPEKDLGSYRDLGALSKFFVKHEIKRVLKYIGVKTCITPQAAKSNSTVGIL